MGTIPATCANLTSYNKDVRLTPCRWLLKGLAEAHLVGASFSYDQGSGLFSC